jgi:hypothetical protein
MTKVILLVALIIFLVVVGPFVTIWALNTLFPVLAIGYSLQTWAAIVLLGGFLRANVSLKK